MTRSTALAVATSVALSAAGAAFAIGTTLGIFGAARDGGSTGRLSPVAAVPDDEPEVETVYVDVTESPVPAAPPSSETVEEVVVVTGTPRPAATASYGDDDHEDDEDDGPEDDHEDDEDDGPEDEHEDEGFEADD